MFTLAVLLATSLTTAAVQDPPVADSQAIADSLAAVQRARDAQTIFERRRIRWLSIDRSGRWGGDCDEILGRMCLTLVEVGDWWPEDHTPELIEARDELLTLLDEAQRDAPGDPWIVGQRVVYRAEAGRWGEALGVARACRASEPGWCAALEGFALHGLGLYEDSEPAFRRALTRMPADEAERWRDAEQLLDRDARELLDRARAESPDEHARFLDQLWRLADPLLLVPGNDRLTEHFSRRVLVRTREDARNPFGMSWGDDLADLIVRYGWEVGWQRTFPRPGELTVQSSIVGHHHPYTRGHVPAGAPLTAPEVSRPADWNPAGRLRAPSGYAVPYAPVLLPAPHQIAVLPRGDSVRVVARIELPDDTTYHAAHGHDPLPLPVSLGDEPELEGLFLIPLNGGPVIGVPRPAPEDRGLHVTAPAGRYVISLERWSPAQARAGRVRRGLATAPVLPDVPTLSDLLLAHGEGPIETLDALLPHLIVGDSVAAGSTVRVAWEIDGLGWRRDAIEVTLVLEKDEGGILRSAGRFLGLVGDPPRVALDWVEGGPESPRLWFRAVELALPDDLSSGTYDLRLRVRIDGREPLTATRVLEIHP